MFLNWPIPEKIQTGGVATLFWKRTYFFGHFTLGDSRQDEVLPLEIPHYFFLDHAWKFHFFFYWLLEFPILFFQSPWKCPQPPPPPTVFFWNSPWGSNSFTNKNLETVNTAEHTLWTTSLQTILSNFCSVLVLCQPWQPCNNESANNRLKLVSAIFTKW